MGWVTLFVTLLKLIGSFADMARETKQTNEGQAEALTRVMNDAIETNAAAKAARDTAAARDATDAGLRQSDGFSRD